MKKALLIFTLFLCSCAGLGPSPEASINSVNTELKRSIVCCKKISDLSFETLSFDKPVEFRIDRNSKSFNFDSGKSFFKAINLKQIQVNKTLVIRSYFIRGGHHYFKEGYVFKPMVYILDDKLNIIKTISPDIFTFHHDKAFGENHRLEGNLLINPITDKYLIIATTAHELSSSTEATIVQGSVYGTFRNTYQIAHSAVGSFKLELK